MADYLSGLRKLFSGATQARMEQQEQQIRTAPVQASTAYEPSTGAPTYDDTEQARAERQMVLEEALRQLSPKPIDGRIIPRPDQPPRYNTPSVGVRG